MPSISRASPSRDDATVSYDSSSHLLTVTSNGSTVTMTVTNPQDTNFNVIRDATGGTEVVLDRPPVAANDTASVTGSNVISTDATTGVLANDTDPDGDPIQVTTFTNGPDFNVDAGDSVVGTFGILTLNPDGSYLYSASSGGGLAEGQVGHDVFTYTVADAAGRHRHRDPRHRGDGSYGRRDGPRDLHGRRVRHRRPDLRRSL